MNNHPGASPEVDGVPAHPRGDAQPSASWWRRLFAPTPGAQALVRLLREDPSGWTFDAYVASHKATNINIWIANETYGLSVWAGDRNAIEARAKPSRRDQVAIRKAIDGVQRSIWEKSATAFFQNAQRSSRHGQGPMSATGAKPRDAILCDYCGNPSSPDDWSDVASAVICPACIEHHLQSETKQ